MTITEYFDRQQFNKQINKLIEPETSPYFNDFILVSNNENVWRAYHKLIDKKNVQEQIYPSGFREDGTER